ncbi:MAG: hypothetical protein AAGD96_24935, partial [Chloroflexota bacterium]
MLDSLERYAEAKPAHKQIDPEEKKAIELPPKRVWWRSMWRHHTLYHYHRLVWSMFAINAFVLIQAIFQWGWFTAYGINLVGISNLVVANIGAAIIIRQQFIINILFKVATSVPTSWPLWIRQIAGKVYHFGGIHKGGNMVGTLWFALFVGSLIYSFVNGLGGVSAGTIAVTGAILLMLVILIVMALPNLRQKYHDYFELTHRFGGWTALALFWAQTIMFTNDQRGATPFGEVLVGSFSFWMLVAITVSIIIPWLRLKKVPVDLVIPSNHVALANFDYGVTPFAGSSTTISRDPLREWHSFANVPAPGQSGYRLTISRAGDWTGALIDDKPSHVWVKGIPTAGVGNVDKLFKRVVWIATGSGIGPTLPHLLTGDTPARLVWSTRNARKTYGDDLVDEILAHEPDALVWNTDVLGRPDLVKLAYEAVVDFDAEAVIVISNEKLTRM